MPPLNEPYVSTSGVCYHVEHTKSYIIPNASLVHAIFGCTLLATFVYTLYRTSQANKHALAGIHDARKHELAFSVHVSFAQACSVWAGVWAVYKLFSIGNDTSKWYVAHAVGTAVVVASSCALEMSLCLFLLQADSGRRAAIRTLAITSVFALVIFVGCLVTLLRYPGFSANDESYQWYVFVTCAHALIGVFYGTIACMYGRWTMYCGKHRIMSRTALVRFTTFLSFYYCLEAVAYGVIVAGHDAGICVDIIGSLMYFTCFAHIIITTLRRDSRHWQNLVRAHERRNHRKKMLVADDDDDDAGGGGGEDDLDFVHIDLEPVDDDDDDDDNEETKMNDATLIPPNQLIHVRPLFVHDDNGNDNNGNARVDVYKWMGKEVVVKCYSMNECTSDHIQAHTRETTVLRRLRHMNVIELYGVYLNPPQIGIVMEYCTHGSLYDILNNHTHAHELTRVTTPLRIALAIAQGCEYLHSQHVLHRDLKSPNILLTQQWTPKIADFGDARIVLNGGGGSSLAAAPIGTPMWMAPEVVLNLSNITYSADVYSFGVVLWELLTWTQPFYYVNDNTSHHTTTPVTSVTAPLLQHRQPPPTAATAASSRRRFVATTLAQARLCVNETLPMPAACPEPIRLLLEACFDREPKNRPPFPLIIEQLSENLDAIPAHNYPLQI